jgi:hypothetical protein
MSERSCVIRRTIVVNERAKLPRPKVTQQVLHIGTKYECELMADELRLLPENQSTEDIQVEITTPKYAGQKTGTSARPGNGSR